MKKQTLPGTKNKLIFYTLIMIFPVIQFIVFWIIVNFNSIMLSFKSYANVDGNYIESFVGLKNIFKVYRQIFTDEIFAPCLKNSFLFYGISTLGGTVFSLSFSYYIYKKGYLGGFYKVMLFLPHIVSGMVITVMYQYFADKGLPRIAESLSIDLVLFGDAPMAYIIFYNLVLSFGSNMLVYTGTMASISDSMIEAAQIDGVNVFQEFFHIIMPAIFRTFALFIVTGMIAIFNGQGNMFNFFGTGAPQEFWTFGYYLYIHVKDAGVDYTKLPYLAAFGLCLTFIAIPIIFSLRYLLNKFGPSAD